MRKSLISLFLTMTILLSGCSNQPSAMEQAAPSNEVFSTPIVTPSAAPESTPQASNNSANEVVEEIEIKEADPTQVFFFTDPYGIIVKTEYKQGTLYCEKMGINLEDKYPNLNRDTIVDSVDYSDKFAFAPDGALLFLFLAFPESEMFDVRIDLYDDNGEVAERLIIKNAYNPAGIRNFEEIEEYKEIKHLFGFSYYPPDDKLDISTLTQFESLQSISIDYAYIDGDLGDLSSLTHLKTIIMDECVFESDTKIEELESLEMLFLFGMQADETVLESIPNSIKYLYLFHVYNIFNLEALTECNDIEELCLVHGYDHEYIGEYVNIAFIEDLEKLKSLVISSEDLKYDLRGMVLSSAEKLELEGNGIICDISDIAGYTNLKHLEISDCENISGDLSELSQLAGLVYLEIDDCPNITGDVELANGEIVSASEE